MEVKIVVKHGDITQENVDAIVVPANSKGVMGGGVAAAIKKVAGTVVEDEAVAQAPIYIGTAVVTSAGNLKARYVIHSPTMENPASRTDLETVEIATITALMKADELKCRTIAMPEMGTGVGGVNKMDAARVMVDAIKQYGAVHLREVRLVGIDDEFVMELKNAAGG